MKIFILVNFIIFAAAMVLFSTTSFNLDSPAMAIFIVAGIIFEFGVIYLMRRRSGGNGKASEKPDSDREKFSNVGSGDPNIQVKPVDLSGNVFEHARETYEEDMKNLDLEKKK